MKIQQVHIKEFQGLSNIDFAPEGHHVILIGDNGRGKSRVIRALQVALGKKIKLPDDVQGKFTVEAEKDGTPIIFEVKIKDGKPIIEVQTNGLKDTRKGTLAGIVGAIDFDVHEFVELSKTEAGRKKQVEIFKSLMAEDIRIELGKYEAHVEATFNERTDVNREITKLKGAIEANPLRYRNLDSFEKVDATVINKELIELRQKNDKRKDVEQRMADRVQAITKRESEIKELQKKLDDLKSENMADIEKNMHASEWLEQNPLLDTSEKENLIVTASEKNLEYQRAQDLKSQLAELKVLEDKSGDLTVIIESARQAISDTIKQMDSPVDGLTYEGDTLIYNGNVVSDQVLSYSEIGELGIKLKLAENPDLGILFIENTESWGKERLQWLFEMAKKTKCQMVMEKMVFGQETLKIEIIPE